MSAVDRRGPAEPELVRIDGLGRCCEIEVQWLGSASARAPLVVFLHEGLGSRSMWRDFPAQLCAAGGYRGLVYSRPGYGRSTPRGPDEHWRPDFMHRQAETILPALFEALGVDPARTPPVLFGHSDGGSIALLHAAAHPARVAGLVVLAPHILVEDITVASIAATREAYLTTDLRHRLGRHHADPDSAFWGWNDIWLDPAFRAWDIRPALPSITCPVLAIQGEGDQYGTMAQISGIREALPDAELLALEACGHSPHRDQPDRVIAATTAFIGRLRGR